MAALVLGMSVMLYVDLSISFRKECGLEHYVPESIVNSMKRKDIRKLVSHYLKVGSRLSRYPSVHDVTSGIQQPIILVYV